MSCTKDEFNNQKGREKVDFEERSNTNKVLVNFLELRDDHYFLNITKSEARGLGISEESYLKTFKEIENTNRSLDSLRKEGLVVELTDPKKVLKNALLETKSSGTLNTNDKYSVSEYTWVPQGIKSFGFYCSHNSPDIISLYTCGVAPNMGQCVYRVMGGPYGVETLVIVPYPNFAQTAMVSFSTSDIKGGKAHYYKSLMD